MGQISPEEEQEKARILNSAQSTFDDAIKSAELFGIRLSESEELSFWPLCQTLETFTFPAPLSVYSDPHAVVACDGSQILPTQHEIYSCYLINIGTMSVRYGDDAKAHLRSFPLLFHRQDELFPLVNKRRVHVDERIVSLERNLLELETLLELSAQERAEHTLPMVAFLDGSLMPFDLESMPSSYQETYLERAGICLAHFQDLRIPLIGYLSHSRSSELLNALRTWLCPYPSADCHHHCGQIEEEKFPCSSIWPISDRQLLASLLADGGRSSLMISGSKWSKMRKKDLQTCFTYLNAGSEVARLELPRWLAEDKDLLNLSLSITLSQCRKGLGYPVSLSESHNLAVVQASDRRTFFDLLARHLQSSGTAGVAVSPKEARKRRGFV